MNRHSTLTYFPKKAGWNEVALLFTVFIFAVFHSPLFGQSLTYDVKYFTTNNGLSDHRVYPILEHSNGTVWVGTMNRFDGYEFFPVQMPGREDYTKGTSDAFIYKLFELTDGRTLIVYSQVNPITTRVADIFDPYSEKRVTESNYPFSKKIIYPTKVSFMTSRVIISTISMKTLKSMPF